MPRMLFWPLLTLLVAGCGKPVSESAGDGRAVGGQSATSTKEPDRARPQLERVTLGLNWFPEAEHGGFYAALAHGYFQEQGLEVKINKGGANVPIVQEVARGSQTFGVVNADNILFGRAQEAPVMAVMAPLQISPRCILVHESSGITSFDGLKDMTIAMSSANAFSHYLRKHVPLPGVKIVPYPGNVVQFLRDKNYAQQGYVFSEPFVARKQGGDPRVLMLSDLGFNPYTSLLFTSEAIIREKPELVRKMVAAAVRGWVKYIESPDEANRLIHQANPDMDLDILQFGAEQLKPLVLDDMARQQGIGQMSLERWQTLATQLIETDQLKPGAVDVRQAFTTEFLDKSPAK